MMTNWASVETSAMVSINAVAKRIHQELLYIYRRMPRKQEPFHE